MRVQVVWAVEAEQWVGEEGVEWILVTSLPVESIEEAQRMLAWYRFRWLIEVNQSQYPDKRGRRGGTWETPAK